MTPLANSTEQPEATLLRFRRRFLLRSRVIRQWVVDEFVRVVEVPGARRRALRLGVTTVGIAWGVAAMVSQARWRPSRPQRVGEQAEELRALLSEEA